MREGKAQGKVGCCCLVGNDARQTGTVPKWKVQRARAHTVFLLLLCVNLLFFFSLPVQLPLWLASGLCLRSTITMTRRAAGAGDVEGVFGNAEPGGLVRAVVSSAVLVLWTGLCFVDQASATAAFEETSCINPACSGDAICLTRAVGHTSFSCACVQVEDNALFFGNACMAATSCRLGGEDWCAAQNQTCQSSSRTASGFQCSSTDSGAGIGFSSSSLRHKSDR